MIMCKNFNETLEHGTIEEINNYLDANCDNCPKYWRCDNVAMAVDRLKEMEAQHG